MSSTLGPTFSFSSWEYHLLNEFSHKAWGHPERFLKNKSSGAGDIGYIDLDKYIKPIELCFFGTHLSFILARDEYRVALTALQHARYTEGAYVTGQPGIGKTVFLVYLLVYLLGQKIAVVLQLPTESHYYAFFSGEGVSVQSTGKVEPIDGYQGRIWGLCDSNHVITTPNSLFHRRNRMQVILTTSAKTTTWKKWAKQTGARRYIMSIWSIEEVKKLAVLSNRTVERMVELARKWGGVPRTILWYYFEPDDVAEEDYRSMADAVSECRMILQQGAQLDLPDGAPSSFYFVQPQDRPDSRFRAPYVSVPTCTLRCLLAEALRCQAQAIKLEFLTALSTRSETRQAAGYIYESWFHSFFSTPDQSVMCEWVSHGDGTQELSSTSNIISATQDTPASWTPPFYWIPSNKSFPGIDSTLVLTDKIITFQVTMAKEPKKPTVKQGLSDLRDLLPANLKGLPWCLVFVGMEVNQIQRVAVWWVNKISFPTEGESVRIGWTVVDPVREDVVYTQYRDEDEPA